MKFFARTNLVSIPGSATAHNLRWVLLIVLSLNHHHNNNFNGVVFLTLYIVLTSAIKNKDKISRTCVMQDRRSPLAKRKNGGNSKDLYPIKVEADPTCIHGIQLNT